MKQELPQERAVKTELSDSLKSLFSSEGQGEDAFDGFLNDLTVEKALELFPENERESRRNTASRNLAELREKLPYLARRMEELIERFPMSMFAGTNILQRKEGSVSTAEHGTETMRLADQLARRLAGKIHQGSMSALLFGLQLAGNAARHERLGQLSSDLARIENAIDYVSGQQHNDRDIDEILDLE